jgi:cell division protein FtsA
MQNDKIVVGLDIGSTKVCAVVARQDVLDRDRIEILGFGKADSEGVNRGVISNIEKTVEAIKIAIARASQMSNIRIEVVNVGIAGQHIRTFTQKGGITRHSTEDEISNADVMRLINDMYKTPIAAGSQILHVMPQDFIVDNETDINDPVGMAGVKLEANFHIITAQTTSLDNIKKCIKKAGLTIQDLILEPIASSLACLTPEERKEGVALVDIGGGTTDLAVFYDNILRHTAVIPYGGKVITSDIKSGCMLMENQAELLKVRFGKAIAEQASSMEVVAIPGLRNRPAREISLKNLAKIIEARMTEIIEEVYKEILRSGCHDNLSQGIVLTGGGSLLEGIKELFELHTGLPVRIGHPTEYLTPTNINHVNQPSYATAIGLALAGFRSLDDRDLLPQSNNNQPAQTSPTETSKKEKITKNNSFSGFLNKIIDRTKNFLLDDVDDKDDY